jgi:hypothetical protein
MSARRPRVVIRSARRADGALSVVETWETGCVLSDGRELLIRWTKLASLTAELCQERAAIWVRTWMSSDGDELIECHRLGGVGTSTTTDPSAASEVF